MTTAMVPVTSVMTLPEHVNYLYVAYLGRPADPAGQAYWSGAFSSVQVDITTANQAILASTEFIGLVPAVANGPGATVISADAVLDALYQNLFGRVPDTAGKAFWLAQVAGGHIAIDQLSDAFLGGATGADAIAYRAKLSVAQAFTAALDKPDEVLAYSGAASNTVVRAFIAGVKDEATATAALSKLDDVVASLLTPVTTGIAALVGVAPAEPLYG